MPTIDITENDGRIQYTATASQTEFTYDFVIFNEEDIAVVQNGTTLTLTTHYTVSGVENENGGTVTLVTGATSGDTITLFRDSTIARASQYQVDGRLDAGPLERDMDTIFTILQEQERDIARAVTLDVESSLDVVSLPVVANEVLGWNAGGTALTTYSFGDISTSIDTVFSDLTSGDLLQYDGTNWVNVDELSALTINTLTAPAINATNIDAATSGGGSLRSSGDNVCISWGGGGAANSTLGGNMSGASTHKLVNMADPTAAQDYATKNYVDNNGGGLVLLGSYTASNATSVDIGSGLDLDAVIDGTYDEYVIKGYTVTPATDGQPLYVRTSNDTGSTFDSGASDYDWGYSGVQVNSSAASTTEGGDQTAAQIQLNTNTGSTTGEPADITINLFKPSDASQYTKMKTECVSATSGANTSSFIGYGKRVANEIVDAIRILFGSGNITSGTFYLYGIRKS